MAGSLFAQQGERIVIVGDSLIGRTEKGMQIREVIGNVVMTQKDVRITCNRAIQYLSQNEAELIGNVIATQDSITIKSEQAYYYGNREYVFSDTTVWLNDGNMNLTAENGYYYFNSKTSYFYDDVYLEDTSRTMVSDKLTYYQDINRAVASGSVIIRDSVSSIAADSIIHYRDNGNSFAYRNIKITEEGNSVSILGNYLEDFPERDYSRITGEPMLMQIDTSASGNIDTLFIRSELMESVKDSTSKFVATDSVKILRGGFSSNNNYSVFYRDDDYIFTYHDDIEQERPVLWYDESQLVGDSVFIHLNENELNWIDIRGNGFILTQSELNEYRYDQISGSKIELYFEDGDLAKANVLGNILSIYYMYDDDKPNGLIQSSAESAKLFFNENKVEDVRLYGLPASEYHPEPVVKGNELDFTLPAFIIFTNRPLRNDFDYKRN